jgi:hypothetical protein
MFTLLKLVNVFYDHHFDRLDFSFIKYDDSDSENKHHH